MELKEILIGLGSSGLGAAIMNYFNMRRTAKRDDFEKIVATWQADNDRLRKENENLRRELDELHLEMDALKSRIIILEAEQGILHKK